MPQALTFTSIHSLAAPHSFFSGRDKASCLLSGPVLTFPTKNRSSLPHGTADLLKTRKSIAVLG